MVKAVKHSVIHIYSDGGSRGNPGPAGIGVVLFDEKGGTVAEISKYIGDASNNAAEYLAAIYGLQEAMKVRASRVVLKVDSQLVARQLRGEYRVKDQNIKKLVDLALNLIDGFEAVEIIDIPREENERADELVNEAIDGQRLL